MRIPLRKHPVITLVAVLIICLLVWGFWPQPALVEAVAAQRAPLTITIEEEGRSRVIDRYVISAPVDGVACRLQLDVGDHVEQNQPLLRIRPLESQGLDPRSRAQARARVAAAEAALAAVKEQASAAAAAAQLAGTEFKRLQALVEEGAISHNAFDKAATKVQTSTATHRSADFNVEVARYELEAARTALQYTVATTSDTPAERVSVRSPISGKILKVMHECEGPVRTGESLLEVGDPSALEIEVDVLSADAVQIKPGMKVLFDRWGGEHPLEGTVRTVEPVGFTKISALGVEEQRVLIISDFTSPAEQWQRLGDGYRVEARFILWHKDNILQVPASSLFRYQNGWAVFVVANYRAERHAGKNGQGKGFLARIVETVSLFVQENYRAERRAVKVGQRNGLLAQIIEGVKENEAVINHPSEEIEDGKRVLVRTYN